MMKTTTAFTALLIASAGGAFAADTNGSMKDDFGVPGAVVTWSGPYVGVALGFGQGSTDYFLYQDDHGFDDNQASGLVGSFTAGFNWQTSPTLLLGVEGDIGFIDAAANHPWQDGHSFQSNYGTWATLRGRVGYAIDRVMVFGTGGLAYLATEETVLGANGGRNADQTSPNEDSHLGWVVGGGVEYALTERVNLKADYLHMEFEKFEGKTNPGARDYDFENSLDIVRTGLNYRF